ncbi:MAG: pre-toxin TG domain-containing protein, partial [Verrucomicrobiota bacterium]
RQPSFVSSVVSSLNSWVCPVLFILLVSEVWVPSLEAAKDYSKHNILRINVTTPRPASCYSPKIGHYDCLRVGVVIVIKQPSGAVGSLSTSHRLTGGYVDQVRQEFGPYAQMYFDSAQKTLGKLYSSYQTPSGLELSNANQSLMEKLVIHLNQYTSGVDLAKNPEAVFSAQSLDALYGITEALIRADENVAVRTAQLNRSLNLAKTLTELFDQGLDVGTSLTPFVNDARDLYELVTGRDLITGDTIGADGRFLSAVALIGGNGSLYRKAVDKLKKTFWKKTLSRAVDGMPHLEYKGAGRWVSKEGLIYRGKQGVHENRLRHILKHGIKNPKYPGKSLFNVRDVKEVPALLDEAWKKRGPPVSGRPGNYVVDMGRVIGTRGEKKILISVEPGTSELITAFPKN